MRENTYLTKLQDVGGATMYGISDSYSPMKFTDAAKEAREVNRQLSLFGQQPRETQITNISPIPNMYHPGSHPGFQMPDMFGNNPSENSVYRPMTKDLNKPRPVVPEPSPATLSTTPQTRIDMSSLQ